MATSLFRQLNVNHRRTDEVSTLMQVLRGSSNPEQTLSQLATNNPKIANVLKEVRDNGGDAKSLFFQKARDMGIDPISIINQLKM